MKKAIIVSLALITLGVLGYQAYRHYLPYHNQKVAAQRAQDAAQAAVATKQVEAYKQQLIASQNAQTTLVKSYNTIQAECTKGVNAYNQLSTAIKAKTAAPSCGAQLIQ